MATVGTLDVLLRLNSAQFQRDMQDAAKRADKFGRDMQRTGRMLSTRVTLPLVAIGAAAVKMSVDAEESANKFNVVMGSAADDVRARFDELHDTIPLTRDQMESLAAGVQDLLVPLGLVRDEAAFMSADMVELAGDLASFNNVAADVPLEAIKSALAGMSRPLRQFGVDVSETRLQTLALSEGIIQQGEAMSQAARAQAVMIAVQRDSADAMGDAARTADSAANTFRFLMRDVRELAQIIGDILVPVLVPLVQRLNDLLKWLRDLEPATQRWIVGIAAAAAALGPLLLLVGTMITMGAPAVAAIAAMNAPLLLIAAAMGAAVVTGKAVVDNWAVIRHEAQPLTRAVAEFFGGVQIMASEAAVFVERFKIGWLELRALVARGEAKSELLEQLGDARRNLRFMEDAAAGVQAEIVGVGKRAKEAADAVVDGAANAATAVEGAGDSIDAAANATARWAREMEILERRAEAVRDQIAHDRITPTRGIAGQVIATRQWSTELRQVESQAHAIYGITRDQAAEYGRINTASAESASFFEDNWLTAIHSVGAALGGMASQVANVVGAFAMGGPGAGIAAAGGMVAGMFGGGNRAQQIDAATREVERALDRYVDALSDRTRWENLAKEAEDGARRILEGMIAGAQARTPGRGIHHQETRAFLDSLESLPIEEALSAFADQFGETFGPEAQAALDAYRGHLERIEETRQRDIAAMSHEESIRALQLAGMDAQADMAILLADNEQRLLEARALQDQALIDLVKANNEAAVAAHEAARAERELADQRAFTADLAILQAKNAGDELGAFLVQQQMWADQQIENARALLEAGTISQQAFDEYFEAVMGTVERRVSEFEENASRAARSIGRALRDDPGTDSVVRSVSAITRTQAASIETILMSQLAVQQEIAHNTLPLLGDAPRIGFAGQGSTPSVSQASVMVQVNIHGDEVSATVNGQPTSNVEVRRVDEGLGRRSRSSSVHQGEARAG